MENIIFCAVLFYVILSCEVLILVDLALLSDLFQFITMILLRCQFQYFIILVYLNPCLCTFEGVYFVLVLAHVFLGIKTH